MFILLYCIIIRPHLEYAIQVTLPYWKKDTYNAKRFQRLASRKVKGLNHLPYIQRLPRLKLCSLEKRRRRADLILTCGIFHGRYELLQDIFFTQPSCSPLGSHDLKLRYRSFHLGYRRAAFSVRMIEPWNKLTPFVINSLSVTAFKNRLHTCWETIFGSDEPQ